MEITGGHTSGIVVYIVEEWVQYHFALACGWISGYVTTKSGGFDGHHTDPSSATDMITQARG